jgi:Mn-dependent DtxR family transcriptional regulator
MLSQNGKRVRSIDIVSELGYSKPSISAAMKNLRANGYISMDSDGYITLTATGKEIAETMYERHILISDWLIFLGVDKKTAVHDACKIEHSLSEQSFAAIKSHIENWKHDIYSEK